MPTLEQIQAKLKKLQAQADVLIARKAQDAVDQIRALMLKHGLTTMDIEAKAKARRAARGLNGHGGNGKVKAVTGGKPAKYRDHKTGATWTGHGRAPGWIAGVKDRTQYLIEGAGELKSVAKAAVAHAKSGKGQPKGAQPPKYHNPKTGATWSGRGRKEGRRSEQKNSGSETRSEESRCNPRSEKNAGSQTRRKGSRFRRRSRAASLNCASRRISATESRSR